MKTGLWAAAAALVGLATMAHAQERHTLHTRAAATAQARTTGRLPATQQVSVAMTLQLRNEPQLDALLQELYDPASPNYRKFLSVSEFTERFAPTAADYAAVASFATTHGLTVTHEAQNRLVLEVSGPVTAVEQAFHVNMKLYQHPTENRTYFAPDVEPSVETGLAVSGVSGLNSFHPPSPVYLQRGNTVRANATGSMGGYFLGSDIRAAYLPGVTLTGAGQAIGLRRPPGWAAAAASAATGSPSPLTRRPTSTPRTAARPRCATHPTWPRKPIPTTISAPMAAASAASAEPASRRRAGPGSWRSRTNTTAGTRSGS